MMKLAFAKGASVGFFAAVASCVLSVNASQAQEDVGAFYAGKTVNVIVGFGPGGGYDLYARLLARFEAVLRAA